MLIFLYPESSVNMHKIEFSWFCMTRYEMNNSILHTRLASNKHRADWNFRAWCRWKATAMAGCAAGLTFGVSASHRGKPMDFLDTGGIHSPWVFPWVFFPWVCQDLQFSLQAQLSGILYSLIQLNNEHKMRINLDGIYARCIICIAVTFIKYRQETSTFVLNKPRSSKYLI